MRTEKQTRRITGTTAPPCPDWMRIETEEMVRAKRLARVVAWLAVLWALTFAGLLWVALK